MNAMVSLKRQSKQSLFKLYNEEHYLILVNLCQMTPVVKSSMRSWLNFQLCCVCRTVFEMSDYFTALGECTIEPAVTERHWDRPLYNVRYTRRLLDGRLLAAATYYDDLAIALVSLVVLRQHGLISSRC